MKSILKLLFLLVVLAKGISAQGQNLSTCLLLDLPFDGSIADQSTNSFTTSSSSTPSYTVDRKGNVNGAVVLNGTSDFITLNSNSAIITTSSFSVSSWIKMSGAGGGGLNQNSLFEQRDDATGSASAIVMNRTSAGTFNFSARKSGSSSQGLVSTSTIGYNQWYHLVMIVKI